MADRLSNRDVRWHFSWSRPGQHNWDETLAAVSASSTMYNTLQNKQQDKNPFSRNGDEALQLHDIEATSVPQIQELGFLF